jgi:hypothetical protein
MILVCSRICLLDIVQLPETKTDSGHFYLSIRSLSEQMWLKSKEHSDTFQFVVEAGGNDWENRYFQSLRDICVVINLC